MASGSLGPHSYQPTAATSYGTKVPAVAQRKPVFLSAKKTGISRINRENSSDATCNFRLRRGKKKREKRVLASCGIARWPAPPHRAAICAQIYKTKFSGYQKRPQSRGGRRIGPAAKRRPRKFLQQKCRYATLTNSEPKKIGPGLKGLKNKRGTFTDERETKRGTTKISSTG